MASEEVITTLHGVKEFLEGLAASAMLAGEDHPAEDRRIFYSGACEAMNHVAWVIDELAPAPSPGVPSTHKWLKLYAELRECECSCNIVDKTTPVGDDYNFVCEWCSEHPEGDWDHVEIALREAGLPTDSDDWWPVDLPGVPSTRSNEEEWTIGRCEKENNHAPFGDTGFCRCTHVMYADGVPSSQDADAQDRDSSELEAAGLPNIDAVEPGRSETRCEKCGSEFKALGMKQIAESSVPDVERMGARKPDATKESMPVGEFRIQYPSLYVFWWKYGAPLGIDDAWIKFADAYARSLRGEGKEQPDAEKAFSVWLPKQNRGLNYSEVWKAAWQASAESREAKLKQERDDALKLKDEAWERVSQEVALSARILGESEKLRECLRRLVEKLDVILPKVDAAIVMETIHGRPYTGPNLAEELAEAKKLLNP